VQNRRLLKPVLLNPPRCSAPRVTLTCSARDSGPGIPEAEWADAGQRYARRTGVSPESAGLGLAIVAEVARAHGGELAFAKRPDGFEARLVLPRAAG
jgi:two-component system, OmpR family, sensor histidine kinase TctE